MIVFLGISLRLKNNEGRQVVVHAAEAVCQPGAEARLARIHIPSIHEHDCRLMVDGISVRRLDKGEIVHHPSGVGKQIADPGSGLAVLVEGPVCRSNRETGLAGAHSG